MTLLRIFVAEWLLWLAAAIMPDGPERRMIGEFMRRYKENFQ